MQYYCYAFEKVLPCFCVKQHSVNCIPAALYLVTQNFPEWITLADARIFISNLFVKPEGFSEEECQVREHILSNILSKAKPLRTGTSQSGNFFSVMENRK